MPDADEAKDVTGYVRGTITPFGSKTNLPVLADERIANGRVSIGGGEHGLSLTVDGKELVSVLGAEIADITRAQEA